MSLWTFLGSYHPVAIFFGGLAIVVFAINFVQLMRAAARFCKASKSRQPIISSVVPDAMFGGQRMPGGWVRHWPGAYSKVPQETGGKNVMDHSRRERPSPFETAEDLAKRREALRDYEF